MCGGERRGQGEGGRGRGLALPLHAQAQVQSQQWQDNPADRQTDRQTQTQHNVRGIVSLTRRPARSLHTLTTRSSIDAIYKQLTRSPVHPLGGTAYLALEV